MIYVIMGMHRSGTSAIAGLLHDNNIIMGEDSSFYPRPSPENPKGYFEDVRFRNINDALLKCNHLYVDDWDVPEDAPFNEATPYIFDDACVLINDMQGRYPNWGWKDPRNCLTWPFWATVLDSLDLLRQTKIIGCTRDPAQVAKSMIKRGNRHRGWTHEDLEHHFMIVACKYEQCMRLTRPDVVIDFTDTPDVISFKLTEMMGWLSYAMTISFLDHELRQRTP